MKWIVLLLLVAAGAWAYFNVDFSQPVSYTHLTLPTN